MVIERMLRRLSVRRRLAMLVALLLLPMVALSIASAVVLNEQEMTFQASVEESIHALLPLTTVEHYLEQAQVDDVEAASGESVPDFSSLTLNIDHAFSSVEISGPGSKLPEQLVKSAQKDWLKARPSVAALVEQVHALHGSSSHSGRQTQTELSQAIQNISQARRQLTNAVKARYRQEATARRVEITWLILSWIVTFAIGAFTVGMFLQSILRPVKALGIAAQRLGAGEKGVRAPVLGDDELTAVAKRFNEMSAHLEATQQTLMTEATADPLTGVFNRRGIMAALAAELADPRHQGSAVSLFMIDLDYLKPPPTHS